MSSYDVDARPIPADSLPPAAPKSTVAAAGAVRSGPYPKPKVPVSPVLSWGSLGREAGRRPKSILDAGQSRLVSSGRVAIAMALREMHIGAGDSVLVPSYHCASMIEPVTWSGATPVFYRINPDTSVNLDDIAAKVGPTTRLLLAANYYGFPQQLEQLRAFCDERGLLLLEDCAHCFLGEYRGQPVGSFGDYAIASSMKFFPIYEGGALVSARHSLANVQLHSAGLGFEGKAALSTLEDSFQYGRLGAVKALLRLPLVLKNLLWKRLKARRAGAPPSLAPGSSDGGFAFDPYWMGMRSSVFSRLMMRLVSHRRMGEKRRRNYLKLEAALTGLPGARPLFPTLPDGVYPWGFPLLTDDPQRVFATLKWAAVPVIRFGEYLWPGVDASVCAVSVDLSRRVLQFPVHQELREDELDWIISMVRHALSPQGTTTQ